MGANPYTVMYVKTLSIVFLLFASTAFAADNVVYIAFQRDAAGAPADTFKSWNHVETATESLTNMVDEDGNATVFDMSQEGSAGEHSTGVSSAGSGDAAWVDEAIISEDGQFVNSTTGPQDLTFSDLDDAKTYTFEFYGSWDVAGSLDTEYSPDDFTSVIVELLASENNSNTVTLDSVSPSSGSIVISWRRKGSDANGFMTALKLTEDLTALARRRNLE